ncbi:MAG TPA: TRAP transporter small permease [Bacteroidota bacterium]|nr:TRAP transporter small permease [Bacteroidota bacterium]
MKLLLFVDRWLARITGWLIIFFLSVMILMAFGQVVLRNFFHTSIEWGDVFLRHLVLWLGFLGAVIATGEGRHLKIEFINKLAPERFRKIIYVVTNLFAAGICFLLMEAAIAFVQMEGQAGDTLILNLPITYFIIIIPAGYGIISFRFIVRSAAWLAEIVHGNWHLQEEQH